MKWIITADHINTGADEVSKVNKCRAPKVWKLQLNAAEQQAKDEMLAAFKSEMNFEFQLFDDDGNLYYEGLCLDLDDQDEESAFQPLDWAEADVGCTYMMYRKVGATKWQQL